MGLNLLDRRAEIASKRIVVGFDGFADTIDRVVRETASGIRPESYFPTIRSFGEYLIAQAEKALCRGYGLNSVRIEAAPAVEERNVDQEKNKVDKKEPEELKPLEDKASQNVDHIEKEVDNAFARTEAIRRAALQKSARPAVLVDRAGFSAQKVISPIPPFPPMNQENLVR